MRTSFLTSLVTLSASRSARARGARALSAFVAALLSLAVITDTADAQRRRRRRRTAEPAETAEPAATETAPAEAAPETPPPSTPATTTAPSSTPPAASTTPPAASTVVPATPTADPGPLPPDLGPLRADWSTLMDDMVSARQRVATLGEELFRTRMAVTVQDRAGDDQLLTRFAMELDGTPIFHTDAEIEGGDAGREVFEAALAPGPHVLTIELEQSARDGTEYRYTQRDTFRFIVVRDRRTEITVVLEDDSDIARSFPAGGEGRYEIRTRVRVATRALE